MLNGKWIWLYPTSREKYALCSSWFIDSTLVPSFQQYKNYALLGTRHAYSPRTHRLTRSLPPGSSKETLPNLSKIMTLFSKFIFVCKFGNFQGANSWNSLFPTCICVNVGIKIWNLIFFTIQKIMLCYGLCCTIKILQKKKIIKT